MQNTDEWAFPQSLRPNAENLKFNLTRSVNSVVKVRTLISADAFTAGILGTERIGSGVLINENGLIPFSHKPPYREIALLRRKTDNRKIDFELLSALIVSEKKRYSSQLGASRSKRAATRR